MSSEDAPLPAGSPPPSPAAGEVGGLHMACWQAVGCRWRCSEPSLPETLLWRLPAAWPAAGTSPGAPQQQHTPSVAGALEAAAAAVAAAAAGIEAPPGEPGLPREPFNPGLALAQVLRAYGDSLVTPSQWEALGQLEHFLSDVLSSEGFESLDPEAREEVEEIASMAQLIRQVQRHQDALLEEAEVRGACACACLLGWGAIERLRPPRSGPAAGERPRPALLPVAEEWQHQSKRQASCATCHMPHRAGRPCPAGRAAAASGAAAKARRRLPGGPPAPRLCAACRRAQPRGGGFPGDGAAVPQGVRAAAAGPQRLSWQS